MNVLLICSQGASTASMCKRIEDAAAKEGVELETKAVAIAVMEDYIGWADVVLVGPQIRFMLEKVRAAAGDTPVEAIDMMAYGMMDGAKVLQQVKEMSARGN